MIELAPLGIFDNPVFQNELLFLLVIAALFGLIGLAGKSETLALFGPFLFLMHVVQAVGPNVPELWNASWVVIPLLLIYMTWRLVGDSALGSEGA